MQSSVCRPFTQCRLWKTTALAAICQWAAEQDRPVSCCGCRDDAPGRRDVAPCRTALPLLDHRPRDLRPLVERHLIMIKERVFIGRFRRPRLSHLTCSSDKKPRPSARPPEGSLGGVISSGRASQHPFNGRLHPNVTRPSSSTNPAFPIADWQAPASAIPIKSSQVTAPICTIRLSLEGYQCLCGRVRRDWSRPSTLELSASPVIACTVARMIRC